MESPGGEEEDEQLSVESNLLIRAAEEGNFFNNTPCLEPGTKIWRTP